MTIPNGEPMSLPPTPSHPESSVTPLSVDSGCSEETSSLSDETSRPSDETNRLDGDARFRLDVKNWLRRTGYTQNELARRAGVDKSQLSRALRPNGSIPVAVVEKIGIAISADATTVGRWLGFRSRQRG